MTRAQASLELRSEHRANQQFQENVAAIIAIVTVKFAYLGVLAIANRQATIYG